jgi:hypothetical protein
MRPDQRAQLPQSRAGTGPAPQNEFVFARVVVISGSGISGFFEYQGTPAHGNTPILWATPPGVLTDPFGNTLPDSGGIISEQFGGGLFSQLFEGLVLFGDTRSGSNLLTLGQIGIFHTPATTDEPILQLTSPASDSAETSSIIEMLGGPGSGTANPQVLVYAVNNVVPGSAVTLEGFYLFGPLKFISGFTRSPYLITVEAVLAGAAGDLTVTSANDGAQYDTQRGSQIVPVPITISGVNTVPTWTNIGSPFNIANGSVTGEQYEVHVHLVYTEAAAAVPRFTFTVVSGTIGTASLDGVWQQNNSTNSFGGVSPGPGSPVAGPTMASHTQILDLSLMIQATAANTSLQLQANTSIAGDNYTVTAAQIDVFPVTV